MRHLTDDTSDLFVPSGVDRAPLVVMIPGGAWRTADPAGLLDLARALADRGIAVMTTTIRAEADGVLYPIPVEDVLCAVTRAVTKAADAGLASQPVVLFGHSSGGHLAALAALAGDRYDAECRASADALIGAAGSFDVAADADVAVRLFGVPMEDAPDLWREGNPVLQADRRPELPVLLVHGDADRVVPMHHTDDFAAALRRGGHEVTVRVVAGADHDNIYRPEAIADLIAEWVLGL